MADAPLYTTVPGKISTLLQKIQHVGVPPRVTNDWLRSVGFTSSNDRSLRSVLRQIEFIDSSDEPTPAWRQYRGAESKKVLGRAIREGYSDLYSLYPDAHERSAQELADWFSTKSDAGQQAISKAVATFKNLAAEAEFGSEPSAVAEGESPPASVAKAAPAAPMEAVHRQVRAGSGATININVQLTLPETTDEAVYEAFFRAMREHLLEDNS